jgi:hypothetical protein
MVASGMDIQGAKILQYRKREPNGGLIKYQPMFLMISDILRNSKTLESNYNMGVPAEKERVRGNNTKSYQINS